MPKFRVFLAVALLCAMPLVGFAQQQNPPPPPPPTTAEAPPALTKEIKQEILASVSDIVTKRAFVPGVDLSKWPDYLAKQQDAIDKAEDDAQFVRAVNSALRDLGISHVRFLAPRAAQARVQTSAIGVGCNARPEQGGLVVTMVYANSPADTAGIKQGDQILEIDGKPATADALQGDEGSTVKLKLKTGQDPEREVSITRQKFSVLRADTLTWMGDDAAVLKIHSFTKGYDRAAIEGLMTQAAKAKYLVLDLRSNGGGATTNLNHLLSLLLPPDTVIGTFVSRTTADDYKTKTGKDETDPVVLAAAATRKFRTRVGKVPPFTGKIAVLINRGSASASEICTTSLRDSAGAVVVGTNSMGAVLASVFRSLPHGYEIQYPIEDYVSGKGVRLEKNPIVPDVQVTDRPKDGEPDPAVEKALSKLRGTN